MIIRKVVKTGNSLTSTLPKGFAKEGDHVKWLKNDDGSYNVRKV